jgi:hypothetical protein
MRCLVMEPSAVMTGPIIFHCSTTSFESSVRIIFHPMPSDITNRLHAGEHAMATREALRQVRLVWPAEQHELRLFNRVKTSFFTMVLL